MVGRSKRSYLSVYNARQWKKVREYTGKGGSWHCEPRGLSHFHQWYHYLSGPYRDHPVGPPLELLCQGIGPDAHGTPSFLIILYKKMWMTKIFCRPINFARRLFMSAVI